MHLGDLDALIEFNLRLERLYPEDTANMLTSKIACF